MSNPELRRNYTRAQIMANIEEYGVNIGESLSHKRLEWVYEQSGEVSNSHWPEAPKADLSEIKVVQESDKHLLLYKPYGVPVQPGAGHADDTLVNWLTANYSEQSEIMETAKKSIENGGHDELTGKKLQSLATTAGLVHRLDKDTQGLILVARNAQTHTLLQDEFRNRNVTKKYLALVHGVTNYDASEHEHYQARDKRDPRRQKHFLSQLEASHYDEKFRDARSTVTTRHNCSDLNQSIVEIQIHTGRMHQIRVLCEALHHPLVADKIYSKTPKKKQKVDFDIKNDMNEQGFQDIKKNLFKGSEFGLLSNEIQILDIHHKLF